MLGAVADLTWKPPAGHKSSNGIVSIKNLVSLWYSGESPVGEFDALVFDRWDTQICRVNISSTEQRC